MNIPTLIQVAKETCRFLKYQDNTLWYRVEWKEEVPNTRGIVFNTFDFPIPLDAHAGGTFLSEEKAIGMMRWIREHRDALIKARDESTPPRNTVGEPECDDCGRTDGHDASCFYHGPY